jgi:hypothetical protein
MRKEMKVIEVGSVTSAKGFYAGAAACGLKKGGAVGFGVGVFGTAVCGGGGVYEE